MKSYLKVIVMCLMTQAVDAQWDISAIRKSRTIDEMTLRVSAESVDFNYKGTPKTLDSINYFQVKDEEIRVYTGFMNPLKQRVKVSSESVDDKMIGALNDYIINLISMTASLEAAGEPNPGKRIPPSRVGGVKNKISISISDPQVLELFLLIQTSSMKKNLLNEDNTDLSNFARSMSNLALGSTKESINENLTNVYKEFESASSRNEAMSAMSVNADRVKAVEDALKMLEERKNTLNTLFSSLPLDESDLNHLVIKNKHEAIIKEVTDYISKVKADLNNWYKPVRALFQDIIGKPNDGEKIQIAKIKDLKTGANNKTTLTFEELNYDKSTGKISVSKSKSYVLNFRRYNLFVPVVTTGVFYTNVSFSGYGTTTNNTGEMVVSKVDKSAELRNELAALAHLNFYLNIQHLQGAFLQIGIGPSKEKPLLALGGGVELIDRVNISAGAIWTWQPVLQNLSEGDVVTGTVQIDEDIKYSFDGKPKFYIGISVNLTK